MSEAQRLNMVGGHFIWLWIDMSISSGYFEQTSSASSPPQIFRHQTKPQQQLTRKPGAIGEPTWKNDEVNENRKNPNKLDAWKFEPLTPNKLPKSDDILGENVQQRPELSKENDSDASETSIHIEDDDAINQKSESSTKTGSDFSQGFDPFRVLQRQDDHYKASFGLSQHYQDRNASRDKHLPVNRLILGLRSETNTESDDQTYGQSKKNRRNINHFDNDGDDKFYDSTDTDAIIDEFAKSETNLNNESGEDGDFTPIYPNRTASPKANKTHNFSDDNFFDYFIDNNNFNENPNSKLNFKRTSNANGNHSTSSSFVTYHQFKDFPVGLLALRPIRMNIDRHFIRAAVRVFAATWQKINVEAKQPKSPQTNNLNATMERSTSSTSRLSHRGQQEKVRNRNAHISATSFNAKKLNSELYNRIMRRKRNISTVNRLLLGTLKKRSIQLVNNSNHETGFEQTVPTSMQVNTSLFLNEMNRTNDKFKKHSANNKINNHDNTNNTDNNQLNVNSNNDESMKWNSFSSDLPNDKNSNFTYVKNETKNRINLSNHNVSASTQVNVSVNQNLSGLWKQNSKNKSNIQPFNYTQSQPITNESTLLRDPKHINNFKATEAMVKQASQTILTNWYDDSVHLDDVRQPSNKRQSTWWSTKKEIPPSATQNKRPVGDSMAELNGKHSQQNHTVEFIKNEPPRYLGGCYGNPSVADIKSSEYFSR